MGIVCSLDVQSLPMENRHGLPSMVSAAASTTLSSAQRPTIRSLRPHSTADTTEQNSVDSLDSPRRASLCVMPEQAFLAAHQPTAQSCDSIPNCGAKVNPQIVWNMVDGRAASRTIQPHDSLPEFSCSHAAIVSLSGSCPTRSSRSSSAHTSSMCPDPVLWHCGGCGSSARPLSSWGSSTIAEQRGVGFESATELFMAPVAVR